MYNNENFKVTPFESVVLSSINQCMQIIKAQPESFEALERRAEYSLLSDFVMSTPKIGSKKVCDYIRDIEEPTNEIGEDGEAVKPPMIPMADVHDHIKTHKEMMPQVRGSKAFSLAAPVVID